MERTAILTGARLFVRIERVINRRQIPDDAFQFNFDPVDERVAFETIPVEGVEFVGRTFRLDDQAD